jgi:hypothetical protein
MGYESFKNPLAAKIVQNARNLGFEQLTNEEFVQMLLGSKKMELDDTDRENVEQIFIKLMEIEEKVQLSK